jgi:hypothetical protein
MTAMAPYLLGGPRTQRLLSALLQSLAASGERGAGRPMPAA